MPLWSQLSIKSAGMLFSATVEDIVTSFTSSECGGNFFAVFVDYHLSSQSPYVPWTTLTSLFRIHSAARSPWISGCHVQPPEQWHGWQHLQQLCQIGPTFLPAGEQPRLGEQVVHGGDALKRSGMATSRLSLFWRHQTVDSVTPGKALADLAFPRCQIDLFYFVLLACPRRNALVWV